MEKMLPSKKIIVISIAILAILLTSVFLSGCTEKIKSPVEYLKFSYDGTKLLSISNPHQGGTDVQIWEISSGKEIWRQYPSYIPRGFVSISPNGTNVAIGNSIYDTTSNRLLCNFSGYFPIWSNNEEKFATCHENIIEIWNAINFSKIQTIIINNSILWASGVAFSPDGKELVYLPEYKRSPSVVNLSSCKEAYLENTTLIFEEDSSRNIYWTKNSDKIGLIDTLNLMNATIFIWNAINSSLEQEFIITNYNYLINPADLTKYNTTNLKEISEGICSYDMSSDGNLIAFGYSDGTIILWNASTGQLIKRLDTPIHEVYVPGFEIIMLLIAIAIVLFWKQKKIF